jgi:hypothetical protein
MTTTVEAPSITTIPVAGGDRFPARLDESALNVTIA